MNISVNEFPVKPLSFKGRYYKRVNNANHQLSPIEITDISLQSLQLSWDSYTKQGKTLSDLDVVKIERFIRQVNDLGRFRLIGEWRRDLEKLRLISEDKITNAAWLLFAKDTTEYNVHLGRFKTPSLIIDDKMLNGTLFEVIEQAMNYIIGHIKVAFEITGKTSKRNEIFEYPLPALREMLLNAFIHRDYLSPIDIQIKIFDKSILFYNPGGLYGNLTIEQLKKDNYQANTRNKLIAEAFYLTGDIEKYGSGFVRIRNEVRQYPTMQFSFEPAPNGFLTKLEYEQQKMTNKAGIKDTIKINANQKKILTALIRNNRITAEELVEIVGINLRNIRANISKLKDKGLIERIGAARGGYWKVNRNK